LNDQIKPDDIVNDKSQSYFLRIKKNNLIVLKTLSVCSVIRPSYMVAALSMDLLNSEGAHDIESGSEDRNLPLSNWDNIAQVPPGLATELDLLPIDFTTDSSDLPSISSCTSMHYTRYSCQYAIFT
jgi:hypothetical protein